MALLIVAFHPLPGLMLKLDQRQFVSEFRMSVNCALTDHFIAIYLGMQAHYRTLQTIYEIVKNDPQPTMYPCRPRELILRLMMDWSVIQDHIAELKSEELISTRQLDTLIISITGKGIEKVYSLDESTV